MAADGFNIGYRLKKARNEQKIHLARAAGDLCISKKYLKAFEANDLKALPEPIYAVGFMRAYAEYLNLKSDHFVEILKANFNTPPQRTPEHYKTPSQTTTLGIVLFLALIGSVGFFGLRSVAEPTYQAPDAQAIPEHVATLLEETPNEEPVSDETGEK